MKRMCPVPVRSMVLKSSQDPHTNRIVPWFVRKSTYALGLPYFSK